jgi:hypothetical protein
MSSAGLREIVTEKVRGKGDVRIAAVAPREVLKWLTSIFQIYLTHGAVGSY